MGLESSQGLLASQQGRSAGGERRQAEAPGPAEPGVLAEMSPMAVWLWESGLDPEHVDALVALERQDFQLEVASSDTERLTAAGHFSERTQTLNIAWNYSFQQAVFTKGQARLRTFEAKLNISVFRVSRKTASPFLRKEDIMSLVRGLMDKLRSLMMDDGTGQGSVVLSRQDLQALMARDHGRLVVHLLELIDLTIMLARLKQLLEGGKPAGSQADEQEGSVTSAVNEQNTYLKKVAVEVRDVTLSLPASEEEEPARGEMQLAGGRLV